MARPQRLQDFPCLLGRDKGLAARYALHPERRRDSSQAIDPTLATDRTHALAAGAGRSAQYVVAARTRAPRAPSPPS